MRRFYATSYLFWFFLFIPLSGFSQFCNVDVYHLPADIPVPNSEATDSMFQEFSWNTFRPAGLGIMVILLLLTGIWLAPRLRSS
jgi:hypothetical protein